MSDQEILDRIPHRGAMLLIDEIVSETESTIVCRKTFRDNEFFFDGHFPDSPVVPGVIHCECCMQAGAVLLSRDLAPASPAGPTKLPVATRMDAVKFKQLVRPGDTVEIEVTLNEQVSNASFLTGKMKRDGKLVTRLDFSVVVSDAPQTNTPAASNTEPI